MKIDLKTGISTVVLIGGLLATYFINMANAKDYTDNKVEKVEIKITSESVVRNKSFEKIQEKIENKTKEQRQQLQKILKHIINNGNEIIRIQTEMKHLSRN